MNRKGFSGLRFLVITLAILSVLCSWAPAVADEIRTDALPVSRYSTQNDIFTEEANAVCPTGDGCLWIGSYSGLKCYDGTAFREYGEKEGMTSLAIRSLMEDSRGRLWVGSNEEGVFCLENGSFTHFTGPEGKLLSIRCFAEDREGRIWFGASYGMGYIEDDRAVCFEEAGATTVYTLSVGPDGLLWGSEYDGSVFVIDTAQKQVIASCRPGDLWETGEAYSVLAASDGTLYVGTDGSSIYRIQDPMGQPVAAEIDGGELKAVNAICETADGKIWFCGDNGLGVLDGERYTDLSHLNDASRLMCIREDNEHNIWAASTQYGVIQIREEKR